MYLRFTAPTEHGGTVTRARLAPGPFGVVGRLARGAEHSNDPVRIALKRELDWFNDTLPVPKRFDVKARGRWWSDGVCWFRDDAREMLAHMEALVCLVTECGVPVERNWSRNPGQLLYRDRWQVVAMPDRHSVH